MTSQIKATAAIFFVFTGVISVGSGADLLPGTSALTLQGDLSAQMIAGIDRFLDAETKRSVTNRQKFWHRDFSSAENYEKSVQTNRDELRRIIGAVDQRQSSGFVHLPPEVQTDQFMLHGVRWKALPGVSSEGLRLIPKREAIARVIAIPDADQTPEMVIGLAPGLAPERQFARRLAENGCEVIVPMLINRQDTWSGNDATNHFTNQPHREWIYRQAFEVGRHIIGYEVQKVLAVMDAWDKESPESEAKGVRVGVVGYGEGGLIALYAAALDRRIQAALVSGYFNSRQGLSEEPIYRNVFGLLEQFGDAEIATLIEPRNLIVEYSAEPKVNGPPPPRDGRAGAAPGKLRTPDYAVVEAEVERTRTLLASPKDFDHLQLISGAEGMATGPLSDRALAALLTALGNKTDKIKSTGKAPPESRPIADPTERQHRQIKELEDYTQKLARESEQVRAEFFWKRAQATSPADWETARIGLKESYWENLIGRLPASTVPLNPRSRPFSPTTASNNWNGYEIVLDVFPDVFAWGYLLVPNDLKPGERRPVVVCQHGLEGVPADVITSDPSSEGYRFYKAFGARLANQGFVVFAPHNPYRGGDKFRQLQSKANPLGKSLFSIIIAQHERILDFLSDLPFVDPKRIGFYGLSYGGKTAVRVPAVVDRYALSICSADFNEWVKKTTSLEYRSSFMFTGEYEVPEFNLANTFSYAEMAALIAPRPFMVERGHNDTVAPDEWVAEEYGRVRKFYDQLGIPERTTIEFFDGPHTINGIGTFEFLRRHLAWPP